MSNATKTKKSPTQKKKLKSARSEPTPLLSYWMAEIKAWCNSPPTRAERTLRKEELATLLGKDIQTIKNMYNYGQGPVRNWLLAIDHIKPLKQETLVDLYDSYPYIQDKLAQLRPGEIQLHHNASRLTVRELSLVNHLIETGIQVNWSVQENALEEEEKK